MPEPKNDYQVTAKAGVFVAGIRSPGAGATVRLTAAQAHHALRAGELAVPGAAPQPGGEAPASETPARGRRKAGEAKAEPDGN